MIALKLVVVGILASAIWMGLLWGISQKTKKTTLINIGSGVAVLIYAIVYFFLSAGLQGKEFLALVTLLIWSGRLSFYLYHDSSNHFQIDVPKKMLTLFQKQTLANGLLSVPFLIISISPTSRVGMLELFAFTISYLAIFGRIVTDAQLKSFKKNPLNNEKVCDQGLWRYTKKPDMVFEVLIWTGFFMLAVKEPYGFLAIVAPATVLYTQMPFRKLSFKF